MSVVGAKKYRWRDLKKGERLEYFWMYYKYHLFFGVILAFLLGYTLYGILKPKPDLQVMWMSERYTPQCEYALRDVLEGLDWDTNGDGRTEVMLTYVDFDMNYHDLSYSVKSEISVLVAGQEYSFFLVNGYARDWMLENDLAADWGDLGAEEMEAGEPVFIPVEELDCFSSDELEPLAGTFLCSAHPAEGKEEEYLRQTEALRGFLIDHKRLSSAD